MPSYFARIQRTCLNSLKKGYYHFNVFNYNVSNDLERWLALSTVQKVESYRHTNWKEKFGYLVGLTKPQLKPLSNRNRLDKDKSAQIPFMITRQMKLDLLEMGYSLKDINSLTPSEAHQILSKSIDISVAAQNISTGQDNHDVQDISDVQDINTVQDIGTDLDINSIKDTRLPNTELFSKTEDFKSAPHGVQSGLGKVKLKISSSIIAIDLANSAVEKAINELKHGQR